MWDNLTTALKNILIANTDIEDTFDYEKGDFKSDPVAIITPSGNDAEYSTTTENRRIYAFNIKILVDMSARAVEDAERVMRELVDTVIDDIDKNYTLTGIENPTGKTLLFVEALPSAWGDIDGDVKYRVADITVRCHVNVDVGLIS